MIKNSLEYTKYYYNLSEKIKLGLEFIEKNNLKSFKNGKYNILENDVYVNIQDYQTKLQSEGKWEAHKKYIDIQYIIEGKEKIGIGEIQNFEIIEQYNDENDVEFLKSSAKQEFLLLKENEFVILYPHDVHKPQICVDYPDYVKKAVVKVRLQ